MIYDIAVIGGGVVGGLVARELTKYKLNVVIIEKSDDVAMGASKANSSIVHGGYDPEPNTLKAKLNALGVEKLFKAASELNVPIKRNGSLVCAFSEEEKAHLDLLYKRGLENGITALEIIDGDKARELEENLSESVVAALWVKNAGIVCPYELTVASIGNAMDNGAELITDFEVVAINKKDAFEIVSADGKTVLADYVINCAGTYSGKIASLVGDDSIEIIPRAGEYLLLDKAEGVRVKHTIFQVPTKEGKGILVSPTVDGNLLLGPTAENIEDKSDVRTTAEGLAKVRLQAGEQVANIDFSKGITSFAGLRSVGSTGDFIIGADAPRFINAAGIESPGLSSAPAIAEYVRELLVKEGVKLEKRADFNPTRAPMHAFAAMTNDEKNEVIARDPAYAHVICRCETISEGEILAALRQNPKPTDVDGVKRRTRSGMGRCQGGFCTPYIVELIARELGIDETEVTKFGGNSKMNLGYTKK